MLFPLWNLLRHPGLPENALLTNNDDPVLTNNGDYVLVNDALNKLMENKSPKDKDFDRKLAALAASAPLSGVLEEIDPYKPKKMEWPLKL